MRQACAVGVGMRVTQAAAWQLSPVACICALLLAAPARCGAAQPRAADTCRVRAAAAPAAWLPLCCLLLLCRRLNPLQLSHVGRARGAAGSREGLPEELHVSRRVADGIQKVTRRVGRRLKACCRMPVGGAAGAAGGGCSGEQTCKLAAARLLQARMQVSTQPQNLLQLQ